MTSQNSAYRKFKEATLLKLKAPTDPHSFSNLCLRTSLAFHCQHSVRRLPLSANSLGRFLFTHVINRIFFFLSNCSSSSQLFRVYCCTQQLSVAFTGKYKMQYQTQFSSIFCHIQIVKVKCHQTRRNVYVCSKEQYSGCKALPHHRFKNF